MPHVLIVEDEEQLGRLVREAFVAAGHSVALVTCGPDALTALERAPADLVILDWMLPGLDGLEVCRRIRARSIVPIMMLTARAEEVDRILGLDVGADDYLTKPFEPRELVARVRAHLRRATEYSQPVNSPNLIRIGTLIVDADKRDALCSGTEAHLTDREFELLHLLARHRDKALASDWLFENIWGYETLIGIKTLAVYIRRLRCKIEADPEDPCFLMTVRGFGYKLTSDSGTN